MTKETNKTIKTLGSAIDDVITALEPLDEANRRIAVKAACEKLGIALTELQPKAISPSRLHTEISEAGGLVPSIQVAPADIRSLAEEKRPSTAIERVALVAFYLSELAPAAERSDTVDKEGLKKYFKQAGFPLPKRPEVTLVNARNAGYLDAAGEGKYRLNPVGYNLIAHNLPHEHAQSSRKPQRVLTRKDSIRGKAGGR